MIHYTQQLSDTREDMLDGFFVGWPNPPSVSTHMQILLNSYSVWLAVDTEAQRVVGFVNAVSDGILSAYIPLLEVLPAYQHQGIGTALMTRMLNSLQSLYMVDLLCDASLQDYYATLGMQPATGVMQRHFQHQSGR